VKLTGGIRETIQCGGGELSLISHKPENTGVRLAGVSRARSAIEQGWISMSRSALVVIAMLLLSSIAWGANNNPRLIGGPNALPSRPVGPVKAAAPSGAHLTYYGGRVVSNMQVVQVLWGNGGAGSANGQFLSQVFNTTTPSMATFYEEVLNSAYVDWLDEYNTNVIDHGGGQGTNQTIGRGAFSVQVSITPSTTATTIDDSTIQTELINQINAGHIPMPTSDAGGNNNTYYAIFFPPRKDHHPGRIEVLRIGRLLRLPRHDRRRRFDRRDLLRRSSRYADRVGLRHRMRQQRHPLRQLHLGRFARDGRDDH